MQKEHEPELIDERTILPVSPFLMGRLISIVREANEAMLEPTAALAYSIRGKLQKAMREAPSGSFEGDTPVVSVELDGHQIVVRFWSADGEVFLEVEE